MGYRWKGMRILSDAEVGELYLGKKLAGYYKLYPDGTESEIGSITFTEILEHHNAGGKFGEELPTVELKLLDGKSIIAPEVIDISDLDTFDELGYSLWHTIEEYLMLFGIRTEDDAPDWATVKEVQSKLLDILERCGVQFKFNLGER